MSCILYTKIGVVQCILYEDWKKIYCDPTRTRNQGSGLPCQHPDQLSFRAMRSRILSFPLNVSVYIYGKLAPPLRGHVYKISRLKSHLRFHLCRIVLEHRLFSSKESFKVFYMVIHIWGKLAQTPGHQIFEISSVFEQSWNRVTSPTDYFSKIQVKSCQKFWRKKSKYSI